MAWKRCLCGVLTAWTPVLNRGAIPPGMLESSVGSPPVLKRRSCSEGLAICSTTAVHVVARLSLMLESSVGSPQVYKSNSH